MRSPHLTHHSGEGRNPVSQHGPKGFEYSRYAASYNPDSGQRQNNGVGKTCKNEQGNEQ